MTLTVLTPNIFRGPGGGTCDFYWMLYGYLPVTGDLYGGDDGYGDPDITFSNITSAGQFYAMADSGADNECSTPYEQPLSFPIVQSGVSITYELRGQYSFLCRGERLSNGRRGGMASAIGSFTADGAGNITAGIADLNSTAGAFLDQALTGTYTVDSTGVGELVLQTQASTLKYKLLTVPTFGVNSPIVNATFIAEDANGVGNCALVRLTGGSDIPPSPMVYGPFLLQITGETVPPALFPLGEPLYGQILLSMNGDNSSSASGREFTASSAKLPDLSLTGAFSMTDSTTQRTTLTLSGTGEPSTSPRNFVIYPADNGTLFIMSTDSHAKADLITSAGPQ